MLPLLYLTDKPERRELTYPRNASYVWDGVNTLTLYLHGGRRKSVLHFRPGDAVRVFQQNGIVKLTKVTEPTSLPTAVLWFLGADRKCRCRDLETFEKRLEGSAYTLSISEPELRVATSAKGTMIAAWCAPDITYAQALKYVLRHRALKAPLWYVQKVLEHASMERSGNLTTPS